MTDDLRPDPEFALDAFWNALVRGEERPDAAALDPATADQVIRAQSLLRTQPPAGAEERLRANVMAELARRQSRSNGKEPHVNGVIAHPGAYAPFAPNGRARPTQRAWTPPAVPRQSAVALGLSFVGVAALLLALFGALFVFYQETDHAIVPAVQTNATPVTRSVQSWPIGFAGDPAGTRHLPGPGLVGTPALRWQYPAEGQSDGVPVGAFAAVADGVMYAGSGGGTYGLVAIDLTTGRELWRSSEAGGRPAIDGDGLIVRSYQSTGTGFDLMRISRTDGSVVWRAEQGAIGENWAADVADGVGYIPSGNDLVAFDPGTGVEKWRVPLDAPAWRGPIVGDGLIAIPDVNGKVYGFSTAGGDLLWTTQTDATAIAGISIANGRVVVPDQSTSTGVFAVLDARTGQILWSKTAPNFGHYYPAAVGDDTLYSATTNGVLNAFDIATGDVRWSVDLHENDSNTPSLVGDTLYLGGVNGFLYAS